MRTSVGSEAWLSIHPGRQHAKCHSYELIKNIECCRLMKQLTKAHVGVLVGLTEIERLGSKEGSASPRA
jgi:hypothetical protein